MKSIVSPRGWRRASCFNPDLLPSAREFYASEGVKLLGRGEWRDALCPFHGDKRPSLRVNISTGGFCCMACGARGGDVLDFYRLRYGCGFVEAAKALGCWEVC